MLFNCSNIQQSTFPHQPKAGDSPFLSRTGNVLHAFHLSAFACFPFYKRIFQYLTISPWHMFVYKGRQKHVSFAIKVSSSVFLLKKFLLYGFPLWREGGPSACQMVESRILYVWMKEWHKYVANNYSKWTYHSCNL